ncbi:MAG: UDP-N-acetylmuramoyl-L-alanyl-D-glutamate--2,6-diaminopimelate ligase [Patescibacteria group bacterium]
MKKIIKKAIKIFLPERFYNSLTAYFWHLPKAVLANIFYRFPAKKLRVVGVAGTKGKSTTSYLISQLLESQGKKIALISTTTIKIGGEEKLNDLKMTSADSWYLQKFLSQAVREKCEFVVLETSSHALKQFRTRGIYFEIALLTNLTPDHQEYHSSPEDYIFTHKKMISKKTKALVFNSDDSYLEPFKKIPVKKISFGLDRESDLQAEKIQAEKSGSKLELGFDSNRLKLQIPLPGKFNVYNVLAALSALYGLGFDLTKLVNSVSGLKPAPGRVEKIPNSLGIEIIVDYAHSPESFENFFSAIKPYVKNHLIAATGACGERDASKRPIMGNILSKYCDYAVITNDDPFSEDPEKIARELISGISIEHEKILDRKQAIQKAIKIAQKGDTVVVLGKGAEQWQVFKDKKIPWDDREVIRQIIKTK